MSTPLRAIIVCVDYADLLNITLPYNQHHFKEILIVTSTKDRATNYVVNKHSVPVFKTDAFYANGAAFNKFAALELGLDHFGREGWLCIMDADVLWPKNIDWEFLAPESNVPQNDKFKVCPGSLYTPRRRMCIDIPDNIPHEPYWKTYPLHHQEVEFAGYTQIFHAKDRHLPQPPWHECNWRHAGGPDSFFQKLWPESNKVRPPFEVLHLGPAGKNWCGRVTQTISGEVPQEAESRAAELREILQTRRMKRNFDHEKF